MLSNFARDFLVEKVVPGSSVLHRCMSVIQVVNDIRGTSTAPVKIAQRKSREVTTEMKIAIVLVVLVCLKYGSSD